MAIKTEREKQLYSNSVVKAKDSHEPGFDSHQDPDG